MCNAAQPTADPLARIQEVLDECMRRRASGETLPDEVVIAAHPELMPELAGALRALAIVRAACARANAAPNGTTGEALDAAGSMAGECPPSVLATAAATLDANQSPPDSAATIPNLAGDGFVLRRRGQHRVSGSPARAAQIIVPRQLGPVQLVSEIGRGGMGAVFLGHHQLLKRDVAVKFLLDTLDGPADPSFEQFVKGAQAAASVRHPGLTAIHHADVHEGIPYLVMEYIEGPTLAVLIRRAGKLSMPAALAAVAATTDAVAALHEANIVHRDIKPHNVLLNAQGQVFVTDFGLTLNRPPLGGAADLAPAGTVAYMAPEMFEGVVSTRSDVYALGVMTFELLTGVMPCQGATLDEWRKCHAEAPLPVELLEAAGVDAALIEVLQRATHKNALFRYKSATQFLAALKSACPDAAAARAGAAELAALVCRPDSAASATPSASPGGASSSYYDHLHDRASGKSSRRVAPVAPPDASGATPASLAPDAGVQQENQELPNMVVPPDQLRRLRRLRWYLWALLGFSVCFYLLFAYHDREWMQPACLAPIALTAFALFQSSDPKWLRRFRYRLRIRMFPELARFQHAEERGQAWGYAVRVVWSARVVWVAFGALSVGLLALMSIERIRQTGALQVISYFAGFLVSLLVYVKYAGLIRRQLRARLVELGVPICIPCGYDLRGQTVPRCPECGAAALAIEPGTLEARALKHWAQAKRSGLRLGAVVLCAAVVFVAWDCSPWSERGRQSKARNEAHMLSMKAHDLTMAAFELRSARDPVGAAGKFNEALEILRTPGIEGPESEALDFRQIARCQVDLGEALLESKQFAEAERNLLAAGETYARVKGSRWWDWRDVYVARAKLYDAWHATEPDKGHEQQAAATRAEAVTKYTTLLNARPNPVRDDRAPEVLDELMRHLGDTLTESRRFAEAEQYLLRAEEIYRRTDAVNGYHWMSLYASITRLYDAWHAAEPDKGHEQQAAAAREKLAEWGPPRRPR